MVLNCRAKQIENLTKLLNLNEPAVKTREAVYKVLVLDQYTKDILAPLLRVSDLRKHGITLHLMLDADRQPIPDVPAVYFVQSTPEAIQLILADTKKDLYDSYHINFASACPRPLLEDLASGTVKLGTTHKIARIFDQYLSFAALESSLFSLGLPQCYVALNDNTAADAQIEATIDSVVDGLFCALVTLQVVPIIQCARGESPAALIAARLDARLRSELRSRNNLFADSSTGLQASLARPLLVLLDRDFDLPTMLQHAWTYKPLAQDALGMHLNKMTIASEGGVPGQAAAAATKTYEVDEKDFFWEENGAKPFPEVAAAVETSLKQYKAAADRINRHAAPESGSVVSDHDEAMRRSTETLMAAVTSLPALTAMKRVLDKHTNLATTLLGAIKSRGIDGYHALEEELLSGKQVLPAVVAMVEGSKGSPADKLRLALVALLAGELPEAEEARVRATLQGSGVDMAPYTLIRRMRRLNLAGGAGKSAAPDVSLTALSGKSHGDLLRFAKGTFTEGLTQMTKGMKSLLAGGRQAAVTVALESLMEQKEGVEESFLTFDPKARSADAVSSSRGPYKDVILFMVGGGNYLEREAVAAWAARGQPARNVMYGCTELLSAEDFMKQLGELGHKSGAA